MSYSNNPNLPKARALAMKLLIEEGTRRFNLQQITNL
jgi:hypothetical protein